MSGAITTPRGRQDRVWLVWATQRNNRRRTTRQIATLERRLANLSPPEDDALIATLTAELATLRARYR